MRICRAMSFLRSARRIFHGAALQALYLSTIKICCVRQLENPTIACRNDKNLLCALGLRLAHQSCLCPVVERIKVGLRDHHEYEQRAQCAVRCAYYFHFWCCKRTSDFDIENNVGTFANLAF